jgi:putative ABC transport system permease protein
LSPVGCFEQGNVMKTFWQDLKFAGRMLWKSPGFTFVAVLALALGIGANTCLFSVVNGLLLRPLPYERPEQLTMIYGTDPKKGTEQGAASYLNFKDWEAQSRAFTKMAAYTGSSGVLTERDSAPEHLAAVAVVGDIFGLLGVRPALGRLNFTEEEVRPNAGRVTILTHELWRRRFNGDPQIVGKRITIDRSAATVIGVLPAGFRFLEQTGQPEIFFPLTVNALSVGEDLTAMRGASFLTVIARLSDGASLAQAQAEMETINKRLAAEYPETNTSRGVRVVSVYEDTVGEIRPALFVLLGAVLFVLLIACANVANLSLTRATARTKEIAVRTALGASRGRIVRGLLTESLLLAFLGGAVGLLFAVWGLDILLAALPEDFPRLQDVSLDWRVLGFTFAVSLLTGVVCGLAPALRASKPNLHDALKESGRTTTGGVRRARLRGALVVTEIALSLVLLVGAGLLIKSFQRLSDVKPGFDADPVLSAAASLPEVGEGEEQKQAEFFRQALERTAQQPGVESVAVVLPLPFSGSNINSSFKVEGRPSPPPGEADHLELSLISPNYFRVMSIPLYKGRDFTERDRDGAPPVIIINETLARRHFVNEDPLGKRITVGTLGGELSCEIVGIVGDTKLERLDRDAEPQGYVSYLQVPIGEMFFVARGRTNDVMSLATALRSGVQAVDKDQPIYEVNALRGLLSNSITRQRFSMWLLALFAGLALLLAAVGVFSVMNFTVAGRTHEIGVRMALGAQKRDVLRLIVRQGMVFTLIGVGIGLAGSIALTRVMASQLYGVSATDPATFTAVALVLAAVALLACYIPARRATKVDPMIALRYE